MDPHSGQNIFNVILFWFKHLNSEYPWHMPKSGGSSFIYATKRGGPGQGGARTIIGQLGDSFPRFDGQGSCHQDVWSAPDEPH